MSTTQELGLTMDKLDISALAVFTRIGVNSWEQRIPQRLLIDLSIPIDLSQCEDKLEKTLDYDKLCESLTHFLESNHFGLIETAAEKIVAFVKEHFKVNELTVCVSKPDAIKNTGNISVTITR